MGRLNVFTRVPKDICALQSEAKVQHELLQKVRRNGSIENWKRCFQLFDVDQRGYITKGELNFMLRVTGRMTKDNREVYSRMGISYDADNDTHISMEKLLIGMGFSLDEIP